MRNIKKRIFTEQEKLKIIDMNNKHYSYRCIAEEMNCCYETLKNYMMKEGIQKNHTYIKNHNINENFFENIDTEEKAYFLGLLKTDGFIKQRKGTNALGIQLKLEDEYMIQKFKDALNADCLILHDNRPGKLGSSIEITNKKLCESLKKFEIVPNKTYCLKDIRLDLIPEKLQKHYLRGLLDGDGTIWIEKSSNTVGIGFCGYSKSFVESFQLAIDNIIKKEEHNKITKSNAFACKWKGNQISKKILSYLYDDATIYLERKKKFYDLIKNK